MSAQALQDPFGLVGKTLDAQYRIEKVIGEGGFGVVYRGWHLSLEQPVAIKALKVFADDPKVQEALLGRFKEEAKLLYTLSQSSLHIVRSIDFGGVHVANGALAPYMVLEWLEGRSLAEDLELRRNRGMRGRSLEETMALLAPAAEGLSVAHQRRVAHRDVKPANFFVVDVPPGSPPNVKVLDFGIAKILRDNETGGTKSPFASFTYLYAAPEQLDPRVGATGLATDVYAFALVLTELLTDRPPIDGRDVIAIMKAVSDPVIRPTPKARGATIPEAVEVVCRRALAVDPGARYASMAEFWAALTDAVQRAKGPNAAPTLKSHSSSQQPPPPASHHHGTTALPTPPPGTLPAAQRPSYHQPVAPPPPPPVAQSGMHVYPQAPAPMMPYGPQPNAPTQLRYWPAPVRRMMPQNNSAAWISLVIMVGVVGALFAGCGVLFSMCSAMAGN